MIVKKYCLIILIFFVLFAFTGHSVFSQQDTLINLQSSDVVLVSEQSDSTLTEKYAGLDSIARIRAMLIDSIIDYGKTFVGLRYKYGGITPAGFDCSGFIFHIHRHFNLPMPRVPGATSLMGRVIPQDSLQPGDLVYIKSRAAYDNTIGHVMMVIEKTPGSFIAIHSASHAGVVIEEFNKHSYYVSRYLFANRLPDEFYLRQWNDSLMKIYKYRNEDIYREYVESVIPAEQPDGTVELDYTVKSGDAVGLIASWYGVNIAQIMAWNGMSNYNLQVGKVLKIYVKTELESIYKNVNNMTFDEKQRSVGISSSKVKPKEVALDPAYEYYTVQSGDSPYSISKKYTGITADDIMKLNGISNPSALKIGQKLKIRKK